MMKLLSFSTLTHPCIKVTQNADPNWLLIVFLCHFHQAISMVKAWSELGSMLLLSIAMTRGHTQKDLVIKSDAVVSQLDKYELQIRTCVMLLVTCFLCLNTGGDHTMENRVLSFHENMCTHIGLALYPVQLNLHCTWHISKAVLSRSGWPCLCRCHSLKVENFLQWLTLNVLLVSLL
jgi:hypothetical protein